MDEPESNFADVFSDYVRRSGYTPGQLARLCGVPHTTLVNWLEGRVKRPRSWMDLVQVARALRLWQTEADELLQAAHHPSLAQLRRQYPDEQSRALLSLWGEEEPLPPPQSPRFKQYRI